EYVSGAIQPQPQLAEGATYAPKIKKQDGQLDWKQPARSLWNRVRGLVPWPGSFTHLPRAGDLPPPLLKIWRAEVVNQSGPAGQILEIGKGGIAVGCGRDALRLLVVQREGGRRLSAQEFLTGHPLASGDSLLN